MKIYSFLYNPCIHESAFQTVSVHRTRKGAEMAMEYHKNEALNEYKAMWEGETPGFEFGIHEAWIISEDELQD